MSRPIYIDITEQVCSWDKGSETNYVGVRFESRLGHGLKFVVAFLSFSSKYLAIIFKYATMTSFDIQFNIHFPQMTLLCCQN
jgi:hypothetical protein